MKKLIAVVAFMAFAVPGVSLAETMTHERTGLTFWLPDNWKTEEEDDVLMVTDPAESVVMMFTITDADDVEAFMDGLDGELGNFIKNPKITNGPDTETVNGLVHAFVEGSGIAEGEEIDWDLTVAFGPSKALIILAMGEIDRNQKTFDKVYASIKKAEGGGRRRGR